MHIVTRIKTTTRPTSETDDTLVVVKSLDSCQIEDQPKTAQDLAAKKALGDDRMRGIRIFELAVDEDGVPSIGSEVTK